MPDDDFLRPPEPKQPKPRAKKAPEDVQPTVRLEALFKESFQKRYLCALSPAAWSAARDRKILKDLVRDVGEAEAAALIYDFFFTYEDDREIRWRTRGGHVPDFKSCLPRLTLLRNGKHVEPRHERSEENRREIAKVRRPKP